MDETYKEALRAAQKELEEVERRHTDDERRIARLRQTVSALTQLTESAETAVQRFNKALALGQGYELMQSFKEIGLRAACLQVLKAATTPLTPLEIKEALIARGYIIDDYTNFMASLHSTLKRLDIGGEAESVIAPEGKGKAYKLRS